MYIYVNTTVFQPPPAKKGRGRPKKGKEEPDGGVMSKKNEGAAATGKESANASNKTDWSSVKWSELGQTKDGRYVFLIK